VYGTVRTVVWEDGGREAASYPILAESRVLMHGSSGLPYLDYSDFSLQAVMENVHEHDESSSVYRTWAHRIGG